MFSLVKIDLDLRSVAMTLDTGLRRWRGQQGRQLLGWRPALKRQGEALVVVSGLPRPKADGGGLEIGESLPPPELLLIDPMTALDLAVLLRAARLDVAMPDPEGLHGQRKSQGELMPVVPAE